MSRGRILIVDDEPALRFGVAEYFLSHQFEVEEAESCSSALGRLHGPARFDAAVVDYSLPDGTALNVLSEHRGAGGETPVIVLTAHASVDLAVQSIKDGAEHFLTKPVQLESLLIVVQRVLEHSRNRRNVVAQQTRQTRGTVDPFLGGGPAMQTLARETRRVAATEAPVLIEGETGSGKGVLARWIHRTGPRAAEPCVQVNCATLGREILESELFGHEKGAFTGAVAAKIGLIEAAHRGTVFLDEIADMDLAVQPKLLTVIEEKRFRRLGDVRQRHADVRFIAASHHDLAQLVEEKRFRQDLLFRINTITLTVPPLRERVDDLPVLAEHLLRVIALDLQRPVARLTPAALDAMRDYQWPGNIRELHNVLERATILADGASLGPEALRLDGPRQPQVGPGEDGDSVRSLEEVQVRHIQRVLEREGGNVDRAAIYLGVPRSTLYQRIKKYGLRTSGI